MLKQLRAVVSGILTLALLGALIVVPAPASTTAIAAEAEAEAAEEQTLGEITPFEAMSLVIRRLDNAHFASITGFLDPEIELPVTVEVAIPAGSSVIWMGEPFDGPIVDAPRITSYDMRTAGGLDIYTIVLENHPQAQIEFNLLESPVTVLGDGTYMLSMEYTPLTDLEAFIFITNLPLGSQALSEHFDYVGVNTEGENEYGHFFTEVRGGQPLMTSLTYTAVGGRGTPNESRVSDGVLIALAATAAGVVMVAVLIMMTRRRRIAAGEYDEEWDEDWDEE